MQTGWIVDSYVLDRTPRTGMPRLDDAVRSEGCDLHVTTFDARAGLQPLPEWSDRPVMCLGPRPMLDIVLSSRHDLMPGAFASTDMHRQSIWGSHLADVAMNDDYAIAPWHEFQERFMATGEPMFVRPDVVEKAFGGTLLKPGDLDEGASVLKTFARIDPDTAVAYASPKHILCESRFVVAEGEVVTGSTYRYGGRLDIRSDVPPESLLLAEDVARRPWQADVVYVCDVAIVERNGRMTPRVIELNPFSSSGLYAGDTGRIVRKVSEVAERIHAERRRMEGSPWATRIGPC